MRDQSADSRIWGDATPWVDPRSSFLAPPMRSFSDAHVRKMKNRAWKLPRVWKHRTLPHPLGNHRTVSTSFHTPYRLCLSIGRGQF
jgi:hypothetical protein